MSTHAGTPAPPGREPQYQYSDDLGTGEGWVTFAGAMVMIAGFLNVIYGISGIGNANWLESNTDYVFSNLKTWGWIVLIVGIVQLIAAFSIWNRHEFGRWIGVIAAGLNSIAMLMFIPAYPFGALAVFAIDILVIYGLVVYGGRQGAAV